MAASKTVLVVDDDDKLREAIDSVLVAHGFHVVHASDGAEALVSLQVFRTDVILLDLMMPGMNGWEFLEARASRPELSTIPVVIVTAADARRAANDDHVLEKPFAVEELVDLVSRI